MARDLTTEPGYSAFQEAFGNDRSIRYLHSRKIYAGDPLVSASETANDLTPRIANTVTVVKFFMRTTGPAPQRPSKTAGTDVGMEVWLPDPKTWNNRVRVQIQGGMMGDFRITSKHHFSSPICYDPMSGSAAGDLGWVVSTTDGGHVAESIEDMSYLMNDDGSINREGWKNIAWQATHLLGLKTKQLANAFYGRPPQYSYLYGCSTGGRQAYHSAQKFPNDFDGLLIGCPSITQSLLFPSLLHPLIVIKNNLNGEPYRPGQLEMVSRKAIAAGDTTVTGQHDGYITDWASNTYDPTKDPSVLSIEDGGDCVEDWALSLSQAQAINNIWYGPTKDGKVPNPAVDNGASHAGPENQVWWGKLRGTRIDFAGAPRDIGAGMLAVAHSDPSLASPLWKHPLGKGENRWNSFSDVEFAEAMMKNQIMDPEFEYMDADNPDLRQFQESGNKIMVYHGLADVGVAPQSAVRYYERSAQHTGGIETTQAFHRLFLVPGMGHCVRYRGSAGTANVPIPTLEEMFDALVDWTEHDQAPDHLIAHSVDGKASRPICMYPRIPKYIGGDINLASSFES